MTRAGRPIRFLALVLTGWFGARVAMTWPVSRPEIATLPPTPMPAAPAVAAFQPAPAVLMAGPGRAVVHANIRVTQRASRPLPVRPPFQPDPRDIALAMIGMVQFEAVKRQPTGPALFVAPDPASAPARDLPQPPATQTRRWSASGWLLLRDGNASIAGLSGGQIGGSQTGLRLAYALGKSRRLALYGRISAPISLPGREAALGVDWRPTKLPVRLVAEQRFGLDDGSTGTAVGVVAGIGPVSLPKDFKLESYGQAGILFRPSAIGFADGAVRVRRRVVRAGAIDVTAGAGLWGAVQPDAVRVDIGPSLGVDLPVKRHPLRLSVDWRQRIVGQATPTSGIALSLGADF